MYNDEELIYLYRQGNDWALEELFQSYLPIIQKGIRLNKKELVNLEYDEAECLSRCYQTLQKCIDCYCEYTEASFRAYAYVSIQNTIKSYGRRIFNPKYQNLSYDALSKGEASLEIRDFHSSPTKMLEYQWYQGELEKLAEQFKGIEKAVYICILNGYSTKEMVETLPYQAKNISNAIYRVRKKLKKVRKEV